MADIEKQEEIHHSMYPERTYVSRSFSDIPWDADSRLKRFATKVVDCDGGHVCEVQRQELVIRQTPGGRQEIKAVFFEDDRTIQSLIFQRFTSKSNKLHKISFSFSGDEIQVIKSLLEVVSHARFGDSEKIRFSDEHLREMFQDDAELMQFLLRNKDRLKHFDAAVDMAEYWEFCERRRQLDVFQSLLEDPGYFSEREAEWNVRGVEAVWQRFFERNPWIFGLGLSPVYLSSLPELKLEQVVRGFSVAGAGKRADALMKTNGALSALCFIEIKTHLTPLMKISPYRPGTWSVSAEVSGAVAQCHVTVQAAMKELQTKLELNGRDGEPTGEEYFLYHPRSFLVVGKLEEFLTEHGASEARYRSFELFRRNLNSPEIVTFDELFERAKATVELSKRADF